MISKSKKLDLVFAIILASLLLVGVGFQLGHSFTGTSNTFAVGSLETVDVNFTGSWYRGATDLTDRLLGDWGINLNSTSLNTGQGENELYDMDQNVLTSSGVTFGTLDTGQGANELYDMDQNVKTGSSVTFGGITDSALTSGRVVFAGASGVLSDDAGLTYVAGTDILTVGKLNTGQGDNELYDMDQNVLTSSDVQFDLVSASDVNATSDFWRNGANYTAWIISSARALGWDYYIEYEDGANLNAWNATGQIEFTSASNNHTVIQQAINATSLDSSGNVVWGYDEPNQARTTVKKSGAVHIGPYKINIGSNPLLMPNHFTLTSDAGIIIGTPGANPLIKNMWSNFTYDVTIRGLWIESTSGAGDTGVEWTVSNSTLPAGDIYRWMLHLQDLHIRGFTTPFAVTTTSGPNNIIMVDNIRAGAGTFKLTRVFDSFITDVFATSADLSNVVTNHFGPWYLGSGGLTIGGGTEANPVKGNTWDQIRIDNTNAQPGVLITGYFSENTWSNSHFANQRDNSGVNDNTHDALVLNGTCGHNTWTGNFFGNYPSRANIDTWRYGVFINANGHNNTFIGNSWQFDQLESGAIFEENGPIMDNNFENRRMTFYGGSIDAPLNSGTEYFPFSGYYIAGATEAGSGNSRSGIMDMSGIWANLRVLLTADPGSGNARAHWLRIGGNDFLLVNITGTDVYGVNASYAIHDPGAVPDTVSIKTTPVSTPDDGVPRTIVDFYPDLEDFLQP